MLINSAKYSYLPTVKRLEKIFRSFAYLWCRDMLGLHEDMQLILIFLSKKQFSDLFASLASKFEKMLSIKLA